MTKEPIEFVPHPYQNYAINFALSRPNVGLLLDMGLGKSAIALSVLLIRAARDKTNKHALILAPKAVAALTWGPEIEKWKQFKPMRYINLTGISKTKRDRLLEESLSERPSIYIANHDIVPQLWKFYGKSWPFETVIIDELQIYKNPQAVKLKALKKTQPYTKYYIGLTGTPAPKSLEDIFGQMAAINSSHLLGRSMSQFRQNYFDPSPYHKTPQGYPYKWFLKEGAEAQIYEDLSEVVISMKNTNVLKMPPITYNTISVQMTPKETKIYDEIKKNKVLQIFNEGKVEKELHAKNAGVLYGMLAQLANGAIYDSVPEGSKERPFLTLHNQKIEALERLIENQQGSPLLVFYWYQHDKERLAQHFEDRITFFDGSIEMKDAWNKGEIPVLMLQPSSNARGLNLQEGGHTVCWFTIPTSLENYQQGNTRVFRQGQKNPVVIHHIVTKGTVDELTMNGLTDKSFTQEQLLQALEVLISNEK